MTYIATISKHHLRHNFQLSPNPTQLNTTHQRPAKNMFVDVLLGLGLALPITSGLGVGTVTGVAQGVSEQQKQNAEQATRMLKFHLDVEVEDGKSDAGAYLANSIVTLRKDKLWVEAKSRITRLPANVAHHPFTGFYLAYPDDKRLNERGLVSTISVDPPVLNWIYVDRETYEVKFSNRSGSTEHHVGSWDWTTEEIEDSHLTLEGFEGFVAVEEANGEWALYFDWDDDGLKGKKKGRRTVEISLVRRVLSAQETNKWGLQQEGNIGFKKTREV
ncbi:Hypothetical protein R9X50_00190600 [Acrodontium crateriforme]|uniref:Uncharacterized protein n=1 Tax=Acrodontium crateriforme TaxID=150365 RepID=A0AAQ3RAG7_9PEZI|nr:Hypothetical protein R9X50_00190600 [Acrodontium crateriforme]